jgi:hypothetical protein
MKVDAAIHAWQTLDGPLYQPDAYIRSWRENYSAATEHKSVAWGR